MVQEKGRHVAERLLVADAFARPLCDLLAPARQIFFERLRIARELRPELLDLAAQVPSLRLSLQRFLFVLLELFAFGLDGRDRRARTLENGTQLRARTGRRIGGLPGLRD